MTDHRWIDRTLVGFIASDSRTTVFLQQKEQSYIVEVLHRDGNRTVVKTTYSLSDALREFAETVAQHTNGFTTWIKWEI